MGLLRKIAGLVVEFPDEQGKTATEGEHHDVLASIEQIRQDIANDLTTNPPDFSADLGSDTPSSVPSATGASAPSATRSGDIRLPQILTVKDVYAKANMTPGAGDIDIYRVEEMLKDPEIADLPVETRARSVRMALRSMGKELPELISDAGKRDQVLEAYQEFLRGALGDVSKQVADANSKLQQQVDDFVKSKNNEMAANAAALKTGQEGLASYLDAKRAEEERLFNIVAPFVTPGQNPVEVSGGSELPQAKGGKP